MNKVTFIIEGLTLLSDYDPMLEIMLEDEAIRVRVLSGNILSNHENGQALRDYGWVYSDNDWVFWASFN